MGRSDGTVLTGAQLKAVLGKGMGGITARDYDDLVATVVSWVGSEDVTAAIAAAQAAAQAAAEATSLAADILRVGAHNSYPSSTDGTEIALPQHADTARVILIVVKVTETFADNAGAQPTFEIGITGDTDAFAATSVFTDATAGTTLLFGATLASEDDVLVTAVAATGDGDGAIDVTVLSLAAAA